MPNFNAKFRTERLLLSPIAMADAGFMLELLNTPDWLRFIGDRGVRTHEDALAYVQKLKNNEGAHNWVARLIENEEAIGVISFVKRDYLDHYDIGFAFLPQQMHLGYAFEASRKILDYVTEELGISPVLAISMKENVSSIRLLEKLGFVFEETIKSGQEELMKFFIEVIKIK